MTDRQPILPNTEGGSSYGTLHNDISVHDDQLTSQENAEDRVVVIKVSLSYDMKAVTKNKA